MVKLEVYMELRNHMIFSTPRKLKVRKNLDIVVVRGEGNEFILVVFFSYLTSSINSSKSSSILVIFVNLLKKRHFTFWWTLSLPNCYQHSFYLPRHDPHLHITYINVYFQVNQNGRVGRWSPHSNCPR
jgi:hypothetical protein